MAQSNANRLEEGTDHSLKFSGSILITILCCTFKLFLQPQCKGQRRHQSMQGTISLSEDVAGGPYPVQLPSSVSRLKCSVCVRNNTDAAF